MARLSVAAMPWDVTDPQLDDTLRALSGVVDDLMVAGSYHSAHALTRASGEWRTVFAPRSALYFAPEPSKWADSPLEPFVSPAVRNHGDVLGLTRPVARDHGMSTSGWTVVLHNADLATRYPEAAIELAWGGRSGTGLCVRNPINQRYARALVTDMSERVDSIALEAAHWIGGGHSGHPKFGGSQHLVDAFLSFCVCSFCMTALDSLGFDPARFRSEFKTGLESLLDANPRISTDAALEALAGDVHGWDAYVSLREDAVNQLAGRLIDWLGGVPMEFLSFGPRSLTGIDIAAIAAIGFDIGSGLYGPPSAVGREIATIRDQGIKPKRFMVSIWSDVAPTFEVFRDSVAAAVGIEMVGVYHLGVMGPTRLGWMKSLASDPPGFGDNS